MENELLNFEINSDLKKQFKIWCLNNKTDMKSVLTKYIEKIVKVQ